MCPTPMKSSPYHPCCAIAQCCMAACASKSPSVDSFQALAKFPSEEASLFLTHASYAKEHIPELAKNDCGNWTLTLSVPIPGDIVHPTLTSFTYTITYSTSNRHGASLVQSHILLGEPGSGEFPAGISTKLHAHQDAMVRLSSVQSVKNDDAQGEWSQLTERRQIPLNVRIVEASCLYLQLQVSEYHAAAMLRSLSVDVSATWLEDQGWKRLLQKLHEADVRVVATEAKGSAENAARKAAEAQLAADEQAKEKAEARQRAAEAQSMLDSKARHTAEEAAHKARAERQAAEAHAEAQRAAREIAEANAEKARLAMEHADHEYEVEHEERIEAEKMAKREMHAREEEEHHLREAQLKASVAAEKRAREATERELREAHKAAKDAEHSREEQEKHAREAEHKLREALKATKAAEAKEMQEKHAKREAERQLREAQNAVKHAEEKEHNEEHTRKQAEHKLREAREAVKRAEAKQHEEEHTRKEAERKLQEAEKAAEAKELEEEHAREEVERRLREAQVAAKHAEEKVHQEDHIREELEHKLREAWEAAKRAEERENKEKHAREEAEHKLREVRKAAKHAEMKELEEERARKEAQHKLGEAQETAKRAEAKEREELHAREELELKLREAWEAAKYAEANEHKEKHAREELEIKLREAWEAAKRAEEKEHHEEHARKETERKLREAREAVKHAEEKELQEEHVREELEHKLREAREAFKHAEANVHQEKHIREELEYKLREAWETVKHAEEREHKEKQARKELERKFREAQKAVDYAEEKEHQEEHIREELERKLQEAREAVKHAEAKEHQEEHIREELEHKLREAREAVKHAEHKEHKEKHAREELECKLREAREAVEHAEEKEYQEEHIREELERKLQEAREAVEHAEAEEREEEHAREELELKLREARQAVELAEAKEHKEKYAREELEHELQEARKAIERAEAEEREEERVRKEAERQLREAREAAKHAKAKEHEEEYARKEAERQLREAQEEIKHAEAEEREEERAREEAERQLREAREAAKHAKAKEHEEEYARKEAERQLREAQEAIKHAEAKEHEEERAREEAERQLREALETAKRAEAKEREEKHARSETERQLQEAQEAAKRAEAKEHEEEHARKEAERQLREARDAAKRAEAKEHGGKHSLEETERKLQEAQRDGKLANVKEQEWIRKALDRLPATRRCPNGYGWIQYHAGYRCSDGGHHITWEELHADRTVTKAVADEKEQEMIKRALHNLPANRRCPNGYAWVHVARGYQCTRGGHHITWEELHAVQDKVAVRIADAKEQEKIKNALDKLPADRRCSNGYAWVQEEGGYRCKSGSHHITWEELNAKQEAPKAVIVADVKVQEKIKNALERLPSERRCSNGYAWLQESAGYRCSGGSHYITWEELNAKHETLKSAVVADAKVQEKIKNALEHLPSERRCSNGYAWVQESAGYRCSGGSHYITWDELNAKHETPKAVVVADIKEQERIKIALEHLPADRRCSNGYAWIQETAGYRCSGGSHYITWDELNAKHEAPKEVVVADVKVQEKIKNALERLPSERRCSNGYAWVRESTGYRCSGGSHYITWEELNAKHEAPKTAVIADVEAQEKIKNALKHLPAERRCPNGFAWVQETAGYRCSGGGHHITWEELNAKHEAPKKVVVADAKAQEKIKSALDHLPAERQCPNGFAWVQEEGGYRCSGSGHHITWEELNAKRETPKGVVVADAKAQEKIKNALERLPAERQCPNGFAWVQEPGGYRCSGGGHNITWEELNVKHETPKVVADVKAQEKIKNALKRLPADRQCPNGFAWVQESTGYRCSGGGHHITWEELNVKHETPKVVADVKAQEKIKNALKRLPADRQCPNGFAWVQESTGYRCSGGGHHITWEELDAKHGTHKEVVVADAKVQEKIKNALERLPAERRCSNGFAWVQESTGYRCSGGGHHITWEELNAKHESPTAAVVADAKVQEKIKNALQHLPAKRRCSNGYAWVQESTGYRCTGGTHHITWEELHANHAATKTGEDQKGGWLSLPRWRSSR